MGNSSANREIVDGRPAADQCPADGGSAIAIAADMRAREAANRAERERIEAEMATQDRDAKMRIAALKAELDAVRWSRESLQSEIRTMGIRRMAGVSVDTKSRPWILGAVILASCGFGLLFGWMNSRPVISAKDPVDAAPLAIARGTAATPDGKLDQVATAPTDVDTGSLSLTGGDAKVVSEGAAATVSAKPRPPKKTQGGKGTDKRNGKGRGLRRTNPQEDRSDLSFFEKCGSDPMCGFDRVNKN